MDIAGMVRRIDELGRVVIPKEIRRTLRIQEGEEMTVSLIDEDTVVMKKFSPLKAYASKAKEYRLVIEKACGRGVTITGKDSIVASGDKSIIGKKPSISIEQATAERKPSVVTGSIVEGREIHSYLVLPLLLNGDVLGAVVITADKDVDAGTKIYLDAIASIIAISIE